MPPFEHPAISGSDVYIIAGQSNASGRGSRINGYNGGGLFGNDYELKQLHDPTDSLYKQVDSVSEEPSLPPLGSVWPVFAEALETSSGAIVYFVPSALGGSSITDWLPGVDHQDRSTLYGSMVYRALQAGGNLKAVLWWQGEEDAGNAMAEATYNSHLDTFADAVKVDLGIDTMPAKFQSCTSITDADEDKINDAIGTAWGDNANVITGPDLTGLTADNDDGLGVHLISNANIDAAAALWLTAIETAFGW